MVPETGPVFRRTWDSVSGIALWPGFPGGGLQRSKDNGIESMQGQGGPSHEQAGRPHCWPRTRPWLEREAEANLGKVGSKQKSVSSKCL